MLRVNTPRGTATVISEEISNGGKPVVRVLLDSNGEERIFLRAFVTESDTPVPPTAKPARKPRKKKEKPELVSDDLLCPELDEGARLAPDFEGYEAMEAE